VKDGAGSSWFGPDERGLSDFWAVCKREYGVLADEVVRALEPDLGALLTKHSLRELQSEKDRFLQHIETGVAGDFRVLEQALVLRGTSLARTGIRCPQWGRPSAAFARHLVPKLVDAYASNPGVLTGAMEAMTRFVAKVGDAVLTGYTSTQEEERGSERALAEKAILQFGRLWDSGILGMLICDIHGNIQDANDGFLDLFGYTREELLSGQVRWAAMTPEEWRHLDDDAVMQLKVNGFARPWEKEYFHKNGTRIPILIGVALTGDVECVAFVLDITERKRLEETRVRQVDLELQNRRIQEANRLKSEFLANMSHELRTPLNSIIGFAELLHEHEVEPTSPMHDEFLGDILNSSRHLLQLINDVLDLAKIEAGKLEFRPEQVDLDRLITEVSAVLRNIAANKRIRIAVDVAPEVRSVTLDAARFKQVLYNYLSNAIKFTADEGKIDIRARPEPGAMFRLEVSDTGIGIRPRDLERLFVEFQQLDAAANKKYPGTGLGLALTKRIVEAQSGSVGVDSEPEKGSTFYAILPLRADARTVDSDRRIVVPPLKPGMASVLVVEDDLRDRNFLLQTLSRAGYGVETAATGREAIGCCSERVFDAITLDLLLPDMTGLDVLHGIRIAGKNATTPVLVVSVVAEKGVVGGFAVHDYLRKPVSSKELVESLQRACVHPEKIGSILVVDDDPAARRLMSKVLEQLGYVIECCASGEEALARAEAHRPIAVVLDLMMPGIDGFEFLHRFRRRPEGDNVPVIVWTMKDLTIEDQTRLRQHAQRIVVKGQWKATSFVDDLRALLSEPRKSEGQRAS
jgi:PAS domain S-box-containing protein